MPNERSHRLVTFLAVAAFSSLGGCDAIHRDASASMELDLAAWFAHPCGDVDGDGHVDVALYADASSDSTRALHAAWVLSGRDLAVLYRIEAPHAEVGDRTFFLQAVPDRDGDGRGDLALAITTTSARGTARPRLALSGRDGRVLRPEIPIDVAPEGDELPLELESFVIEREGGRGWIRGFARSAVEHDKLEVRQIEVTSAPIVCGDVDGDGATDRARVLASPPRVDIVSGRDERALRTIDVADAPFATAAFGTLVLGDVDGDGTADRLVGAQVSTTVERTSVRRCELGVVSIVSGADGHAIATLERAALLAADAARATTAPR